MSAPDPRAWRAQWCMVSDAATIRLVIEERLPWRLANSTSNESIDLRREPRADDDLPARIWVEPVVHYALQLPVPRDPRGHAHRFVLAALRTHSVYAAAAGVVDLHQGGYLGEHEAKRALMDVFRWPSRLRPLRFRAGI